MKIKKLLEKCLETFGPNGERWVKGAFVKNVGGVEKFCSIGAIRNIYCEGVTTEDRHATEVLVSKVFAELFNAKADAYSVKTGDVVINKNDNIETTFDQIKSAFERSLALADLAENLAEKTKLERAAALKAREDLQKAITDLQKAITESYSTSAEEEELAKKLNDLLAAKREAARNAELELRKTDHLTDARSTYLDVAEKATKIRPIEQKQ